MNKRRKRYCTLGSMQEVHEERVRLRRMMRQNAKHIEEDIEDIRYALSPARIAGSLVSRIGCSSSLLRNIIAGVRTGMTLLGLRGRRSC